MDQAPRFLLDESLAVSDTTYRPAPVDRRGERVGWLLCLALAVGLAVIRWLSGGLPWLGIVFLVVLCGLAALVSLGNWLETRTFIRADAAALEEHTPLRTVRLAWDEIDDLWAWPASIGWRILVRGAGGQILFRTGERLTSPRGPELRLGFPEGERLAAHVRRAARLSPPEAHDAGWRCRRAAAS